MEYVYLHVNVKSCEIAFSLANLFLSDTYLGPMSLKLKG